MFTYRRGRNRIYRLWAFQEPLEVDTTKGYEHAFRVSQGLILCFYFSANL